MATKSPGYFTCQSSLVKSLLAVAEINGVLLLPRLPFNHPFRAPRVSGTSVPSRRNLHSWPVRTQSELFKGFSDEEHLSSSISASASSDIPWYLREDVASARQPSQSLLDRQRIPELPKNRPANLLSILEHVSVELGMESMHLLDLRSLDPPPALGGNLIMILCTARSDKHLHISADRLCRWLRTEHKLLPLADGLIGRQELKLKIRRQTRRTKILAHVGRGPDTTVNDEIRSGWVCVNVGDIDVKGTRPEELSTPTGFTQISSGTNLVVQLMTEEKREMLDLEGLWGAHMEKHLRRQRALAVGAEKLQQAAIYEPSVADQNDFRAIEGLAANQMPTLSPVVIA